MTYTRDTIPDLPLTYATALAEIVSNNGDNIGMEKIVRALQFMYVAKQWCPITDIFDDGMRVNGEIFHYSMKTPIKAGWDSPDPTYDVIFRLNRQIASPTSEWTFELTNVTTGDDVSGEFNGGVADTSCPTWNAGSIIIDDTVDFNDWTIEVTENSGIGAQSGVKSVSLVPSAADLTAVVLQAMDGGYLNGVIPMHVEFAGANEFTHTIMLRLASIMGINMWERRVGPIISSAYERVWAEPPPGKDSFLLFDRVRQRVPAGVDAATFRIRTKSTGTSPRVRIQALAGAEKKEVTTSSLAINSWHTVALPELDEITADWGGDLEFRVRVDDANIVSVCGWFDDASY